LALTIDKVNPWLLKKPGTLNRSITGRLVDGNILSQLKIIPLINVGFKIIILTIQDTEWWPSGKKKLYQGDIFQTGRISTPLQLKRDKCFIAETANPKNK
jgi:hypothetical protein